MTGTIVYNAAGTDLKAIIDLKNRNEITGLLESSNWRDGLFLASVFTTYQQFDNNPLYIYPAKTETVRTNTPQNPSYFSPVTNTSSTLVKDAKYREDLTFKYSGGNVVEVTGRNGLVTSYLWRDNLPIAKALGVSFSTLNAAYSAAGSDLVLLRSQPSLINCQLSTFTYDPLVGMTSSTDPNGIRITYVYDAAGRLDHVKDKDENIVRKMEYRYKH
jgi:YD repeat-containing protein